MEQLLAEKTYDKTQGSTTTTTTTHKNDSTLPDQQPTYSPLDVTGPLPDKEGPQKSGRVTRTPHILVEILKKCQTRPQPPIAKL